MSVKNRFCNRMWWIILGIILAAFVLIYFLLDAQVPVEFLSWNYKVVVEEHYFLSLFIFMVCYLVCTFFLLPVMAPFSLLGGYLFNQWHAIGAALGGLLLGSTAAFLVLRHFYTHKLKEYMNERVLSYSAVVKKYGAFVLLGMQYGAVPSAVTVVVSVISGITVQTFMGTTILGAFPYAYLYVFTGQKIGNVHSLSDLLSYRMGVLFVILLITFFAPFLIFAYYKRRKV
ncbi:MAG: VTT domain-containing protein [Candidatus Babeliales bacterium]